MQCQKRRSCELQGVFEDRSHRAKLVRTNGLRLRLALALWRSLKFASPDGLEPSHAITWISWLLFALVPDHSAYESFELFRMELFGHFGIWLIEVWKRSHHRLVGVGRRHRQKRCSSELARLFSWERAGNNFSIGELIFGDANCELNRWSMLHCDKSCLVDLGKSYVIEAQSLDGPSSLVSKPIARSKNTYQGTRSNTNTTLRISELRLAAKSSWNISWYSLQSCSKTFVFIWSQFRRREPCFKCGIADPLSVCIEAGISEQTSVLQHSCHFTMSRF